ncbi:MAG: PilW family protein, partial [Gammaproteobacteria bacterium]|nr:PilW family protein [Gammaproteobacteria bacterium]
GFTLIELMISVAIGAFLLAGVFTVFSNGRQTQAIIDGQTQLIDDARFAFTSLSYDLRHAGLWGKTNNHDAIAGTVMNNGTEERPIDRILTDPYPVLPSECAINWYRNLEESFFVGNNANPYVDTCIPNGDYRPETDVMVVKYAPPTAIADDDLAEKIVYISANSFQGELFVGETPPEWTNESDARAHSNYRVKARAYFVNEFTDVNGDGYPSLHRIELSVGPSLSNSMLIPGVEDFQVQLGIDLDDDGSVDRYVDADEPDLLTPDGFVKWDLVKSVQFWVMVRSRATELHEGETQSISMAGRPAQVYGTEGFRRVVMSTVVKLQNRKHSSKAAGS